MRLLAITESERTLRSRSSSAAVGTTASATEGEGAVTLGAISGEAEDCAVGTGASCVATEL